MPDAQIEILFEPIGGMTCLTMVIRYPDAATRKAALDSGMTDGMGATFNLMDAVLEDISE